MTTEKSLAITVKTLANQFHRFMSVKKAEIAERMKEIKTITEVQGHIVTYLYDNASSGPIYQKDVEKHFNIRRSTATVILKRMEKAGVILRTVSGEDARKKSIVLTDKAKKLHPRVRSEILKAEEQARRGLTPGEVAEFIRVAEVIGKNIS